MTYTNASEQQPVHDGRFLCVVRITQPCGITWWVERIVERDQGAWIGVGEGGEVVQWMPLPLGGWPLYAEPGS